MALGRIISGLGRPPALYSDNMSSLIDDLKNVSPQQLAARATDLLPPWVTLLLVVALMWQLGKAAWLFFPRSEAIVTPPAVTVTPAAPDRTRSSFDTSRITGAYLFGRLPAQSATPPPEAFGDIDETDLRLTLRGTIAATEERLAMAIIADDRGTEKVYAVGAPVTAGRKLHSVLPDRAILNNNGKFEALKLPREADSDSAPPTRTSNRRSMRTSPTKADRLRQTIAANPAKLTDLIRPQPVFSNGKQIGYRVYPGRRRQQFLQLGLKPGDLVTDINGTALDDPARGADIFKSLGDANQVTVTVERNGTPQVLVLDPEQLQLDGDTNQ